MAVHDDYSARLAERKAAVAALSALDRRIGNGRLASMAAFVATLAAAYAWDDVSYWLAAPPMALFIALVVWHDRVIRARERAERAAQFYDQGLARLEDRWAGKGVRGTEFGLSGHPYADDLDLFGRASLFELLCTARTRSGQECLAAWLKAPADPATIRARQEAVEELRDRLDLREELVLLGEEVRPTLEPEKLVHWGTAPPLLHPRLRPAVVALAVVRVAALLGWGYGVPWPVWLGVLAATQLFQAATARRVKRVVAEVEKPARDLELLAALLERIEREEWSSPLLRGMLSPHRPILGESDREARPSAIIARLVRLVGYLEQRRNVAFAPVAALLLWSEQLAFPIDAWRATYGPRLNDWLSAVGEFEALCALASHAYEHPDDPFPEIVEDGVLFDAAGIAHPLLPAARAVRNDVALGDDTRLLIVSGSNMSGKSTLLRSVGVNAVLAQAGAPVRARRLRMSPLSLGASIHTVDSLEAGVSRFYAEIQRLRQIVDVAGEQPPALFLLDEILHGTNSHDRRIGAEAVARALVRRGGIGLITTHDLALAEMADDPALGAHNVHFEDEMIEGEMVFDYRLREGVVTRSNAIELMRTLGLEV